MDCVYMSLSNVVFVCGEVECSILNKYYLFQNGRALLKCRIFILLQLVIPTLKSHAATRHVTTRTCPLWTNISRRFSIFRPCFRVPVSCFLCCCRSFTPATVSPICRESLLIFVFLAKIRQDLTSIISPFALFRAFCVVVEFHSSHSFANFAVFYSSFS